MKNELDDFLCEQQSDEFEENLEAKYLTFDENYDIINM